MKQKEDDQTIDMFEDNGDWEYLDKPKYINGYKCIAVKNIYNSEGFLTDTHYFVEGVVQEIQIEGVITNDY